MTTTSSGLASNIARVRDSIASSAVRAGRDPASVQLVAVSKTQPASVVAEAARAGLDCFGENRVQEAAAKSADLTSLGGPPVHWHLVGSLQRNKVSQALSLFELIHSLDSIRLAEAISQRAGQRPMPVLLEVYLGPDPARPGFRPAELSESLPRLLDLPGIELRGLMTVAPLGWDAAATQDVFGRLRGLRDELERANGVRLPELSMGMTDDFPLAIAEGATIVRVGRAIFGER